MINNAIELYIDFVYINSVIVDNIFYNLHIYICR